MKKTIYYWSPFLTKVGTVKSTLNSAISLAKFSNDYNVIIINLTELQGDSTQSQSKSQRGFTWLNVNIVLKRLNLGIM